MPRSLMRQAVRCFLTLFLGWVLAGAAIAAIPVPGDVNGDEKVDALDVVAVINHFLGLQNWPAADVNYDKVVNALDVVFVINQVLEGPIESVASTLGSGGSVELPGVAKIDFPPGSADNRAVRVSRVESAEFANDFSVTATPLFDAEVQNSYQVKVQVEGDQPATAVTATLTVPEALRNQATPDSELRVFFLALQVSEDEMFEIVEPLPDRFAPSAETVTVSIPLEAFQGDSTNFQIYEAVLYLGFTPTASASTATKMLSASSEKECGSIILQPPVDVAPSSPFGPRVRQVKNETGIKTIKEIHRGVDYRVPNGTGVKAIADGTVKAVGFQQKVTGKGWGYYIVIKHSDGSTSLYAHLKAGTALPVGKGGIKAGDIIAQSNNSGGSSGPHLHIEYAPDGKFDTPSSRVNPLKCMGGCIEGQIIKVNGVNRYRLVGSNCSIVADLVTGLEWQRCSVGQTSRTNGLTHSCEGDPGEFTWQEALMQAAPGGFRLPTIEELRSLIYCSNNSSIGGIGEDEQCAKFGGTYQRPTIVVEAFAFPSSGWFFWSSSPYAYFSYSAWYVFFDDGGSGGSYKDNALYVRLVRGGQ